MNRKITKNWFLRFVVVAAFLLLAGSREFISFVVDLLFFREIGFEAVFTKTYTAKLLTGLAFGGIVFFLIFINLLIAGKPAAVAARGSHPADGYDSNSKGIMLISWMTKRAHGEKRTQIWE